MKEKNRFSVLLEHLLSMSNLKNYALAKYLQYDESYISKWVSGKSLPTEKNYEKIISGISQCLVDSLSDAELVPFFSEYQLSKRDDLKKAIYDHLDTEYNYVKNLKTSTGSEIASKLSYDPELTLSQFISKMKHPSLRKVRELDVCALIDILRLDKNYQLMITDFGNLSSSNDLIFPGVHFSMFIDMESANKNPSYAAAFLLNMLTNLSNIDFELYGGKQASGKLVFAVKDAYSLSGLLFNNSHCLAVTSCEEAAMATALYRKVKTLCTKETLLIRKTSMQEMVHTFDYEQSIFSKNQCWLFGHPTEHFLPSDLHDELMNTHLIEYLDEKSYSKLAHMQQITQKIIETSPIRLLVPQNAFSNFIVTGILDFYGHKITLNYEQRLRYMKHLQQLLTTKYNLHLRSIKGKMITDYQHIPSPTILLSDGFCYLRLESHNPTYNICIPNKLMMNDIFHQFFENIWNNEQELQTSSALLEIVQHAIFSLEIMCSTSSGQ